MRLFSTLQPQRSGLLLDKLTAAELIKKFPALYKTRLRIIGLTKALHTSTSALYYYHERFWRSHSWLAYWGVLWAVWTTWITPIILTNILLFSYINLVTTGIKSRTFKSLVFKRSQVRSELSLVILRYYHTNHTQTQKLSNAETLYSRYKYASYPWVNPTFFVHRHRFWPLRLIEIFLFIRCHKFFRQNLICELVTSRESWTTFYHQNRGQRAVSADLTGQSMLSV